MVRKRGMEGFLLPVRSVCFCEGLFVLILMRSVLRSVAAVVMVNRTVVGVMGGLCHFLRLKSSNQRGFSGVNQYELGFGREESLD